MREKALGVYKLTLVFAEIFGLLLGSIWIIYKIRSMQIDDLILNIAISLLLVYVSIGNLALRTFQDKIA